MLLVIDNYDSFVYNIVQYLGELKKQVEVYRNDAITLGDIERMNPEGIVISPGPGRPENAGISCDVVRVFSRKYPLLGVCLGHQCIGHVYGANIVRAERLMHGKTSQVYHNEKGIFSSIPSPFTATRYHSLLLDEKTVPSSLRVDAWTREGEVMGISHEVYKLFGVQFHPEAILTDYGKTLLANFLSYCA